MNKLSLIKIVKGAFVVISLSLAASCISGCAKSDNEPILDKGEADSPATKSDNNENKATPSDTESDKASELDNQVDVQKKIIDYDRFVELAENNLIHIIEVTKKKNG